MTGREMGESGVGSGNVHELELELELRTPVVQCRYMSACCLTRISMTTFAFYFIFLIHKSNDHL